MPLNENIRLIAMDMDDTLLREDWTISERTVQAIRQAQGKGVYVTIATGRMPASVRPYAQQLELDVPVITYNGAMVQEALSEKVLYRKVIPIETAQNIINWLLLKEVHFQVYLKDQVFVEEMNEWSRSYERATRVPIIETNLQERLALEKEGVEKILLFGEPEILKGWDDKFNLQYEGKIRTTKSKPNFLELIHSEVSKGVALSSLAKRLGVKQEEVLAVGDSLNDLEMIQYAGMGVAMGNARQEVKEVANVVTSTNQEDGVAKAIERYVLKRASE
ncbi:Cof-type HAD-IIB family hydrolase [Desulfitobacterium metallireducens]|uniref:Cof-type HAD-IIB family hydrolase n=1 Tax=Desulfitobacterium metallireducens TaxID=142877 RepID=UPI0002314B95